MKTSHPLELDKIGDPVIRSAIEAMNERDKERWYRSFSDHPALTDDGIAHEFTVVRIRALWYFAGLSRLDRQGRGYRLTIYGKFHSDQWGDFKTFFRFRVENGVITKMDVGQTEY